MAERPYAIVFLDWQMPGRDGFDTARAIVELGLSPPPSLVLVTAFGREDVMHHAEDVGIDHILIKPVSPSVLFDTTMMLLGQARGAAISALVHAGLPVAEYTALQTKQAVVGHGKATKDQVQDMVVRLLNLPGAPTADAADALACAICHAHGGQGLGALATAGYRVRGGRLVG